MCCFAYPKTTQSLSLVTFTKTTNNKLRDPHPTTSKQNTGNFLHMNAHKKPIGILHTIIQPSYI